MTIPSEDELLEVRRGMQAALLSIIFWILTVFGGALLVREVVKGGPILSASVACGLGVAGHALAAWRPAWRRSVGLACCFAMVVLILRAALDMGGAVGSALSLAFVPCFLACVVFGPAWGWGLTGLMLTGFVLLYATTPLPSKNDVLRFTDELAMIVFTTGLAHALWRSLAEYECAVARRRELLAAMADQREALATAIYERLEPAVASVVALLDETERWAGATGPLTRKLDELVEGLRAAKALAKREDVEAAVPDAAETAIRRAAMRRWLRLGAVLMAFFVVRNFLVGTSAVPSLFSLAFCFAFDAWLGKAASGRHLEATAFAIGCAATGPMIAHLVSYGPNPDAPPLVVTPATVVFTALLGQRAAPWLVLALNFGILVWVGSDATLTLRQFRLLGDIALSFLVVILTLGCVLQCRGRYIGVLVRQGRELADALQQQRRLSGTLFHDVSNHLQALLFQVDTGDIELDGTTARSLGHRIERLIALSRGFLLSSRTSRHGGVTELGVADVLTSLREVFAPRLQAKALRLSPGAGMDLSLRAEPDLLIDSVLGNLLSNAIKFSAPGSVIDFEARRVGTQVALLVSDRGPGIPRDVLARLGTDAALPSTLGTSGEPGQGYGLQLAQEHVRRMEGHLVFRERSGGGTEAEVWLPSG